MYVYVYFVYYTLFMYPLLYKPYQAHLATYYKGFPLLDEINPHFLILRIVSS